MTATDSSTVMRTMEKQKPPTVAVLETRALGQDEIEVSRHLHELSNMPNIILATEPLE